MRASRAVVLSRPSSQDSTLSSTNTNLSSILFKSSPKAYWLKFSAVIASLICSSTDFSPTNPRRAKISAALLSIA